MKLTSIFLQKMMTRKSGQILIGRNAKWLMSTAVASFGVKYSYSHYQMMQRGYSQTLAEAESQSKKEDPYSRSRAKQLMKNHEDAVIIGGQSNHNLAEGVAAFLGASLAKSEVRRFADGETSIKIADNVNGKHIYIVQPTCPPVNDSLMELLLTISACKRAGAATVTCIIPYYGYARQDRKF